MRIAYSVLVTFYYSFEVKREFELRTTPLILVVRDGLKVLLIRRQLELRVIIVNTQFSNLIQVKTQCFDKYNQILK